MTDDGKVPARYATNLKTQYILVQVHNSYHFTLLIGGVRHLKWSRGECTICSLKTLSLTNCFFECEESRYHSDNISINKRLYLIKCYWWDCTSSVRTDSWQIMYIWVRTVVDKDDDNIIVFLRSWEEKQVEVGIRRTTGKTEEGKYYRKQIKKQFRSRWKIIYYYLFLFYLCIIPSICFNSMIVAGSTPLNSSTTFLAPFNSCCARL